MNISEELKSKAIELGLCSEWTASWGNPSEEELIEMYIRGIDFCIEKNYPSNEYIKERLRDKAEKMGVYVDRDVNIKNKNIIILNGNCKGVVEIDGYNVSTVYIRHNASVTIKVKDKARVFIHVYDSSKLSIESESKTFVYLHGGTVTYKGNVKIRDERFKHKK